MVRRVFRENSEVIWIFDGAEFLFPDLRVIEEVITEHVKHRDHADDSAEQIRPLREGRSHEQAGIGASKDA